MTRIPKYRKQKRKDGKHLAFVEIGGQRVYLGLHGTPESQQQYLRTLAEFKANGGHHKVEIDQITISEIASRYWAHAQTYYRKGGKPTGEQGWIKAALRPLVKLYGATAAKDFGVAELLAVRATMVGEGLVRTSINARIQKLKRMFKWGAASGLVSPMVLAGLSVVDGLRADRSDAIESDPVVPADLDVVKATMEHTPKPVRAMIALQLATGMRPGEVRVMRGVDIKVACDPWEYRPSRHKVEHLGINRVIYLGAKSQEIIRPFLKGDATAFLFSPRDVPGCCAKHDHYTSRRYNRAIARACAKAGVDKWSPNRLRHLSGTSIRESEGIEAAQAWLGHRSVKTTERYTGTVTSKTAKILAKKFG